MARSAATGPACVGLVLLITQALALPASPNLTAAVTHPHVDLDFFIREEMLIGGIPGLSAAALTPEGIVYSAGFGVANPNSPLPPRAVDTSTMFMFASISKLYIGAAAMLLHEEGWLDFDLDVNLYLPDVGGEPFTVRNPQHPDTPITMHMLLTHSSSIDDDEYWRRVEDWYLVDQDPEITLPQFCFGLLSPRGEFYDERSFRAAAPGSEYAYSNVGSACAAYILELIVQAQGFASDYDELVVTHLHKRLSLDASEGGHFFRTLGLMPPPLGALPDSPFVQYRHFSLPDYPASCWRSSAQSFGRFLGMAMAGGVWEGVRLLSEESVDYMLSPSGMGGGGEQVTNALWLRISEGGRELIGHDGSEEGVHSEAWYDTQSEVGFVVLTNGEGGALYDDAVWRIGQRIMAEFEGKPRPAAPTSTVV
eukprot:COSAG05_NODE_1350_length_5113_cov_5.235540_2_plen_422_part_00